MSAPPAVLSVDLEWFSHTPAYRTAGGSLSDADVGASLLDRLLETFDAHDAESTFFTVADVAERYPDLVADIAGAGHEVASHTSSHAHLSTLSRRERRRELVDSRATLERVTGEPVTGFRAPSFDVSADHFDLLADAGYAYDSSVVPCRSIPGWYGGEWTARRPCSAASLVEDAPPSVAEVPVAVMPGVRLPLSGTWLRFFGVRYAALGMRLLARRGITPVLYVHPWEFADLPPVDGVPRRVSVRTGEWMWRALEFLLSLPFSFVTTRSVAERVSPPVDPEAPK